MENREKLKLAKACKQKLYRIQNVNVVYEATLTVQELTGFLNPDEMKKQFCGGDVMVLQGKPDVVRMTYHGAAVPVTLVLIDDGRNVSVEASRRISKEVALAAIETVSAAVRKEAKSPIDQIIEQGQPERLAS
jgi:hypothetical protein